MSKFEEFLRLEPVHYVLFNMRNGILFRLKYLAEQIINIPITFYSNIFKKNVRRVYLFHDEYIIHNKNGTWVVMPHSKMDLVYKPDFERYARRYFTMDSGIFLDIGAHTGKWSVFMAKQSNTNIVYSFEANPQIVKYLKKNIKLNKLISKIHPVKTVISHSHQKIFFKNKYENDGNSRIVNTKGTDTFERKTISISEFLEKGKIDINRIKLIKIDIEGHEMDVLEGFGENISKLSSDMHFIIEISNKRTIRFMKKNGFDGKHIGDENYILTRKRAFCIEKTVYTLKENEN